MIIQYSMAFHIGAQERIAPALCADGGRGAVAGQNLGFVGQSQQAGLDGVDDLAGVAAGQVGAADAAGKERVAGDEQLERGKVEADRALGVAGRVEHLGGIAFQADDQAVGQALVGRRRLGVAMPSQPACSPSF